MAVLPASLNGEDRDLSVKIMGGYGLYEVDVGGQLVERLAAVPVLAGSGGLSFNDPVSRGFLLEVAQGSRFEVEQRHGRFLIETRLGSNQQFGFEFGPALTTSQGHCIRNCGELSRTLVLLDGFQNGTDTGTILRNLVLTELFHPDLQRSEYGYLSLQAGFLWHANPHGLLDPYLGFTAGAGACWEHCTTVIRFAPMAGVELSLGQYFFLDLRAEYQVEGFGPSNRDQAWPATKTPVGLLALGFRF
ncbi:MAG: hypothetical protein KDK25_13050 [Leptospiraceae bacterium]|nr:hypothetical protein [Leptospiraceae bacterium]